MREIIHNQVFQIIQYSYLFMEEGEDSECYYRARFSAILLLCKFCHIIIIVLVWRNIIIVLIWPQYYYCASLATILVSCQFGDNIIIVLVWPQYQYCASLATILLLCQFGHNIIIVQVWPQYCYCASLATILLSCKFGHNTVITNQFCNLESHKSSHLQWFVTVGKLISFNLEIYQQLLKCFLRAVIIRRNR